jgi:hypothetical protein
MGGAVAAAAFRACFLRVAEDADEDDFPPLGMVEFELKTDVGV